MGLDDWKYYNHAIVSNVEPHKIPDSSCIKDKTIWKIGGGYRAVLARWTTDFDCKNETGWWYVIKDTPFSIDRVNVKGLMRLWWLQFLKIIIINCLLIII